MSKMSSINFPLKWAHHCLLLVAESLSIKYVQCKKEILV